MIMNLISGNNSDPDQGKCELLGPIALFVQGLLGVLAISSLVWKRYHEWPNRRPWRIWIYDVSKQVIGASFIHVINLVLSILSKLRPGVHLAVSSQLKPLLKKPSIISDNPCDYYFLNILFDTTIGIPVLYFFIVVLTELLRRVGIQGVRSGEYGEPPKFWNYVKQLTIYLLALGLMKVGIYIIVVVFPVLVHIAVWLLARLDPYPNVQVTFVLLVFPLVMNIFQYYVVDNLIQSPQFYCANKLLHEQECEYEREQRCPHLHTHSGTYCSYGAVV